jgi:hypothetical protein
MLDLLVIGLPLGLLAGYLISRSSANRPLLYGVVGAVGFSVIVVSISVLAEL